jgi:hypothetical protein
MSREFIPAKSEKNEWMGNVELQITCNVSRSREAAAEHDARLERGESRIF